MKPNSADVPAPDPLRKQATRLTAELNDFMVGWRQRILEFYETNKHALCDEDRASILGTMGARSETLAADVQALITAYAPGQYWQENLERVCRQAMELQDEFIKHRDSWKDFQFGPCIPQDAKAAGLALTAIADALGGEPVAPPTAEEPEPVIDDATPVKAKPAKARKRARAKS